MPLKSEWQTHAVRQASQFPAWQAGRFVVVVVVVVVVVQLQWFQHVATLGYSIERSRIDDVVVVVGGGGVVAAVVVVVVVVEAGRQAGKQAGRQ